MALTFRGKIFQATELELNTKTKRLTMKIDVTDPDDGLTTVERHSVGYAALTAQEQADLLDAVVTLTKLVMKAKRPRVKNANNNQIRKLYTYESLDDQGDPIETL